MPSINQRKFYQSLENIFTGANIEGESGYVNLLKIKSSYYKLILQEFQTDVDNEPTLTDSFKEEFFDKLYSFFEKYFSESGSVYFVKTANWQRVYEQVYTDNKDVVLFWKTNMLYYVKSDILFQSIAVNIIDETSKLQYDFYFDVGTLEAKQNNEKKQIIFNFKEVKIESDSATLINNRQGKKIFVFDVSYSERGKKTMTEQILKQTKIPEPILEKAFATFKKQSEVDFFINKNAEKFLTEQLDMYLHQILLNTENKFNQQRLEQLKAVKTFAIKIIEFIAQFEDELVRVWNKPKFALNSNYVVTLDKLTDEITTKIAQHQNLPEQVVEWRQLGMIDTIFDFSKISDQQRFLPIDTKYFKDLELEILSLFENIDEALDGRLIHSENYQALNTLQQKYKEKVQCIYIDPPYNTNSSPIIYINNYKHSSWLTLMANRFEVSKKLLLPNGINITAIDDIELRYLTTLQDSLFGDENYLTTITSKCNPQGRVANKVSKTTEYHIVHAKDILEIDKVFVKKNGIKSLTSLKRTGTNSRREERPNRYYPILRKGNEIEMIADKEYNQIYNSSSKEFDDNYVLSLKNKYEKLGFVFILPLGRNGEKLVWQRTFNRVKKEINTYIIENEIIKTPAFDVEIPKTLWDDPLFSNPEYGSEYLKHLLGHNDFETPKSYHTIKQFLTMFDNNGLYLDYFGGSGTTAEAVIRFNNEDEGERKYIVIELGEHFNTVILPRIKKVCFSDKWKDGKAQTGQGITQFFKYYKLEQYEDTLRNMDYKDDSPNYIFDTKKTFEQYVFYADKKFADVLEVNKSSLQIDFTKLYPNIDFAETLSNLLGLPIKKITKTSVILQDQNNEREIKTDYKNMTDDDKLAFIRLLKPALWWGK